MNLVKKSLRAKMKMEVGSPEWSYACRRNVQFIRELRAKATPEELIVMRFLDDHGIRYIFQKGFIKPFHRIVDFYIPGSKTKRLIIEIDGGCHNDTQAKDAIKDWSAKKLRGIRTLRIRNKEVHSGAFREMIFRALSQRNK